MSYRTDYIRNGAEIYRRSFAIIRAEADSAASPRGGAVAVRIIHACGMADIAADSCSRPARRKPARRRWPRGAPILCDAQMVAHGITRARLPADNEIDLHARRPPRARARRKAATPARPRPMDLWRERLGGAVVAIGNAPTALFRLLEMLDEGAPRPAAIIGMPVGFVGAAESKEALIAYRAIPCIVVHGPRRQRDGGGGDQCAREREGMRMAGRLYGIGLGPGDPELSRVKAVRLVRSRPVVAYFCKGAGAATRG